jgi:hypothetical protein
LIPLGSVSKEQAMYLDGFAALLADQNHLIEALRAAGRYARARSDPASTYRTVIMPTVLHGSKEKYAQYRSTESQDCNEQESVEGGSSLVEDDKQSGFPQEEGLAFGARPRVRD